MWLNTVSHSSNNKSFIIKWSEIGRCISLFLLSVIVSYIPIFTTSFFQHLDDFKFSIITVFIDTLKTNDFKYINISSLVIIFIENVLILYSAEKSIATKILDVFSFIWFLFIVIFWSFSIANLRAYNLFESLAIFVFIVTMIICFVQIISKNISKI